MITSAPQDYPGQFRRMREGSATATSASDAGAPPQSLRGTAGSFDIRAVSPASPPPFWNDVSNSCSSSSSAASHEDLLLSDLVWSPARSGGLPWSASRLSRVVMGDLRHCG
jgi:hypothetical protein